MNKSVDITDKEFHLLQAIEANASTSQRALAEHLGMSLGMINLCLRRLAKKGLIKAQGLNGRKLKYILTPKGFSEKLKKSYHFAQKTINELSRIKSNIQNEIRAQYLAGHRDFVIAGSGELADLAEIALKNLKYSGLKYKRVDGHGEDSIICDGRKVQLIEIAVKREGITPKNNKTSRL